MFFFSLSWQNSQQRQIRLYSDLIHIRKKIVNLYCFNHLHSHRKGQNSLKTRFVLLLFNHFELTNLQIIPYRKYTV